MDFKPRIDLTQANSYKLPTGLGPLSSVLHCKHGKIWDVPADQDDS